jgi:hypothetical protein
MSAVELPEWRDVLNRAESACARARVETLRASSLIATSRGLRALADVGAIRYFIVRGEVEGYRVRAVWSRGHLTTSPLLQQRADVLVALGDEFLSGDAGFAAELSHALPAMLTLIRSCDRVDSVEFGPMEEADVAY